MLIDPGCARVQIERVLAWEDILRGLDEGSIYVLEQRGQQAGVIIPYDHWVALTDKLKELSK